MILQRNLKILLDIYILYLPTDFDSDANFETVLFVKPRFLFAYRLYLKTYFYSIVDLPDNWL